MKNYVADTHALYWHLTKSRKLGSNASAAFDDGDRGDARIFISAIVMAELHYLNENKIGRSTSEKFTADTNEGVSTFLCHFSRKTYCDSTKILPCPKCTTASSSGWHFALKLPSLPLTPGS